MISKETLSAIREYAKSLSKSDKGMTTEEIAKAIGSSDKTTRTLMKLMIQEGRMRKSGSRLVPTIAGKNFPVPVYELIK